MGQQPLWEEFFAERYDDDPLARKIWESSGVVTRHGVADPRSDDRGADPPRAA